MPRAVRKSEWKPVDTSGKMTSPRLMWTVILAATLTLFTGSVEGFRWKEMEEVTHICSGNPVKLTRSYYLSVKDRESVISADWSERKIEFTYHAHRLAARTHRHVTYSAGSASETTKPKEKLRSRTYSILTGVSLSHTASYILNLKVYSSKHKRVSNYTSTGRLLVAEPPVITGGKMSVTKRVRNLRKGCLKTIILRCGEFTSKIQPAISVTWAGPSGNIEREAAFTNGRVVLVLKADDAKPGNYTCFLPPSSPAANCLPKGQRPPENVTIEVTADDIQAKVAPKTSDGKLHAYKKVVTDAKCKKTLILSCGNLTAKGHPEATAKWTSPSGKEVPGIKYVKGQFQVELPSAAAKAGTYSCSLSSPSIQCLSSGSEVGVPATVKVSAAEMAEKEAPATTTGKLGILKSVISKGGRKQIILKCGVFTSRGKPEVSVKWTNPSGADLKDVTYDKNGQFQVVLNADTAVAGKYVCSLPKNQPALSCLPSNDRLHLAQSMEVFADDLEVVHKGCAEGKISTSGVYRVNVEGYGNVRTYCDLDTFGGGWTVFQRRLNGSLSFARNWTEYENGFGNPAGEFWLGLRPLHLLTKRGMELMVEFQAFNGKKYRHLHRRFSVGSANEAYKLRFGKKLCGQESRSVYLHTNRPFSTKDVDNNKLFTNCSNTMGGGGGWWYVDHNYCYTVNMNGKYYAKGKSERGEGIVWFPVAFGRGESLKTTKMMFRPEGTTQKCEDFSP